MKPILLLVTSLIISAAAFCHDRNSADVKSLTGFTPYVTMPDDVSAIFGAPTSIDRGKEQIIWKYNSNGRHLIFYWDLRLARLQKYSFTMAASEKEFDRKQACSLETGTTELKDALKVLGDPRDLYVDLNDQQLHYEFKNSVVNLYFHLGKLIRYQVNGLERRRS